MAEEDAGVESKLDVLQSMIDISADRLVGLRTQCATSAELTQQEIRTLEGKLIKLFSRQLVTKAKYSEELLPSEVQHIPRLYQWLQVVGLSEDAIKAVSRRVSTLESLQEKSEHELKTLLLENNGREEETRRLIRALHNLKKYTEVLQKGDINSDSNDLLLYWDSWDRHRGTGVNSPRMIKPRANSSSVATEESLHLSNNNNINNHLSNNSVLKSVNYTGSLTSINGTPTHQLHHSSNVVSTPPIIKTKLGEKTKYPTTPPAKKKQSTTSAPLSSILSDLSITKSVSHESQLGGKVDVHDSVDVASCEGPALPHGIRRIRLPTEPGPNCSSDLDSSLASSPVKSPLYNVMNDMDDVYKSTNLQVPKSPRTPTTTTRPGTMGHFIAHRFTKTFKMMTTCDFCDKQMFIGTGLKCKECKYKCHRDCESKVPPSCQLPRELLDEFIQDVKANHSPSLGRSLPSPNHHPVTERFIKKISRQPSNPQPTTHLPQQGPDSSSNTSSCNSSTPSSPIVILHNIQPHNLQFVYPDVSSLSAGGVTLETHPLATPPALEELIDSQKSQDSDKTVSVSGSGSLSMSTDSERTPVRVDSQDSQVSDGEPDRGGWLRQPSLSMREWDIPFDELKIGEPIGTGRFGTVYRGNWHGDVAIKLLNMDYLDDEKTLEAFKLEVATFRKTRHENLVLFMGACMKPPKLAIVSSLSKGMTLYTHIHLRKDKFNMNKTTIVAQQISQGMGYLHAKGIVHKDLKSKNIFLENGKVVITDFGLFGVTKLCYRKRKERDGLIIPPGWLCYLSPEIIKSLRAYYQHDEEELPFSRASDVYAFGTIWYELLCGDWPFKGQPPEAIIWQVGKGVKQSLANLQASRDVKDILMMCWSYRVGERPDFGVLLKTLEKLPKKRLARSPSHPIHLSRSAESVF